MIIVIIDLPKTCCKRYRAKSVQIRNFFWSVFSCIRTEYGEIFNCGKIRTRKKLRIWTLFTHWHPLNIRIIKIYFCYFSNISFVMACNAVPSSAPNILTNLSWVPPLMLLRKIETLGEINLDVKIVFFGLQYTKLFSRFTDLERTLMILVSRFWYLAVFRFNKLYSCSSNFTWNILLVSSGLSVKW